MQWRQIVTPLLYSPPQTSVSSSSRLAAAQNKVSLSLDTLLMRQKYFRFTPASPSRVHNCVRGVAAVHGVHTSAAN